MQYQRCTRHKRGGTVYSYYDYTEEPSVSKDHDLSWLTDLIDETDECGPNRCLNNGVCYNLAAGGYQCSCQRPYSGKHCQIFVNPCKDVMCGWGECVLTQTAPFYECKCKAPYSGQCCRKAAACRPDPCLNGATCKKGRTRNKFECICPTGYSGKFCQVGPKDCFVGDGESYRGFVSETVDKHECLPWNSHLIPGSGGNFNDSVDGLGPHSYCRNPDGESVPWCFIKVNNTLRWEYCDVKECTGPKDCFVGDGESYRGFVSETVDKHECLPWNSHLIPGSGGNSKDSVDGLGPHSYCRNPDGENAPWCFIKVNNKLRWEYCDVKECTGPKDCFVGDGESYRGFVSETVDKHECLPWNSHLIPGSGGNSKDSVDGLGPHSYCRNPDGENAPWCFVKVNNKLRWEYCDVKECTVIRPSHTNPPSRLPTDPPSTKAPPSQEFSQCGKPEPGRMISRIFEGKKAKPAAHPWQVSLQVRPPGSSKAHRHSCGGILIGSCWVLTAAHCINPMEEMQVELGGVTLHKKEDFEQIIAVEKALIHEKYRESPDALHNDVALLKLKGSKGQCARETRFVKTACLPTGPLADSTECSISGWGKTETEHSSSQLLTAKVRLISQQRCTDPDVYGARLDDNMICAGSMQGGIDSCQGDSGGPLVCEKNGTHYVYGVVSWGDSCGVENKPGVYVRVTHFIDWIATKLLTDL
ncbi:hyaluronan-binding protein 2 isoform X3 [Clupea harengus]|uniref:trypsin n=1 Tax=Clupea harengus TaxID=7950 RepID=A0A6P8EWD7_CLUHA|nr:hyaluronan-binding protein 2 isoform X3 [Clupea harengus]